MVSFMDDATRLLALYAPLWYYTLGHVVWEEVDEFAWEHSLKEITVQQEQSATLFLEECIVLHGNVFQ